MKSLAMNPASPQGGPTLPARGSQPGSRSFASWLSYIVIALIMAGLYFLQAEENRFALANAWQTLCDWGSFHFHVVDKGSPLLWVLMPALLMVAWAGILLLLFDKPPDWL